MNIDINLLPYALLLVAAVVSLFIKGGDIVNKILTFVVFGAGMFCVYAESGWWRFGFILLAGLACTGDVRTTTSGSGAYTSLIMGVAMSAMMAIKWVIADLFGWNPFWWMTFPAAVFSVMIICNADYKKEI